MQRNLVVGFFVVALMLTGVSVGASTFMSEKNANMQLTAVHDKISDMEESYLPVDEPAAEGLLWSKGRLLVTGYGAESTATVFDVSPSQTDPNEGEAYLKLPLTLWKLTTIKSDLNVVGTVAADTFRLPNGDPAKSKWVVTSDGNMKMTGDIAVDGNALFKGDEGMKIYGNNFELGHTSGDVALVDFGRNDSVDDWAWTVNGFVVAKGIRSMDNRATVLQAINVTEKSYFNKTTVFQSTVEAGGDLEGTSGGWTIKSDGDARFQDLLVDGTLTVQQRSDLNAGANVAGADFTVGTDKFVVKQDGSIAAAGLAALSGGASVTGGDLTVGTNRFTVDEATGDTDVAGALSVAGLSALGDTQVSGDLGVTGNGTLGGDLDVTGSSTVLGDSDVQGNSVVGGTQTVSGAASLQGGLDVSGADLTVGSTMFTVDDATGDTNVAGTLTVAGSTALNGGVDVSSGNLTVGSTMFVVDQLGNLTAAGNADVAGDLGLLGDAAVGGDLDVAGASTLSGGLSSTNGTFTGDLYVGGSVTFVAPVQNNIITATNRLQTRDGGAGPVTFQVDAATGNTQIDGTLSVAGDADLGSGGFTVDSATGDGALSGALTVGADATITGAVAATSASITNAANVGGVLTATGGVTSDGAGDFNSGLDVSGADFTVATNRFVVDTSGNTDIAGTLAVVGDATFGNAALSGTLDVAGASSLAAVSASSLSVSGASSAGSLTVTNNASVGGDLAVTGLLSAGNVKAGVLTINPGTPVTVVVSGMPATASVVLTPRSDDGGASVWASPSAGQFDADGTFAGDYSWLAIW